MQLSSDWSETVKPILEPCHNGHVTRKVVFIGAAGVHSNSSVRATISEFQIIKKENDGILYILRAIQSGTIVLLPI